MFEAIIKIGGSLYHQPQLKRSLQLWSDLAEKYRLLFLPGGGPFTDTVRATDARFHLSDSAAHWMAILGMEQSAYLLADLTPKAVLVQELAEATAAGEAGRLAILAPLALFRQMDPLPHSWQVTSDSMAAWLAGYVKARRLVLLKSVAGVYGFETPGQPPDLLPRISARALAAYDIVDPYFSQALSPGPECWLIDGTQPERLIELLQTGQTKGTQVEQG